MAVVVDDADVAGTINDAEWSRDVVETSRDSALTAGAGAAVVTPCRPSCAAAAAASLIAVRGSRTRPQPAAASQPPAPLPLLLLLALTQTVDDEDDCTVAATADITDTHAHTRKSLSLSLSLSLSPFVGQFSRVFIHSIITSMMSSTAFLVTRHICT